MNETKEARTIENPLTPEDRKTLKGIKTRLVKLGDLITKLENAGVTCDENRELCQTLNGIVDGLEREFPLKPKIG